MGRLFETDERWSGLILRAVLGTVMWPHGASKAAGWFGGHGFTGTMGFFTDTMRLPVAGGIAGDHRGVFGSLGPLAGFLTRFTAFRRHHGGGDLDLTPPPRVFMNWFGRQSGEGFEYHRLVIGIAASLFLTGAGKRAVDGRSTDGHGSVAGRSIPGERFGCPAVGVLRCHAAVCEGGKGGREAGHE